MSLLDIDDEVPPLLLPLFPFPFPYVDEGVEPDELDVPRDFVRSRDDVPISQCSVMSALGEEDPGFVVPNAQMIFSVSTVLT